jgi:hypothetical protein
VVVAGGGVSEGGRRRKCLRVNGACVGEFGFLVRRV